MYLGKKKDKKPWWLPDYYVIPPKKLPGEVNNYNLGRFSVMVCPKCDMAWEYGIIGKRRVPIYYEDFPKYNLEVKTCQDCKTIENKKRSKHEK